MASKTSGILPLGDWARKNVRIRNEFLSQAMAEFLGTAILCLFTTGAGAQSILLGPDSHMMPVFGGILGIMMAIMIVGGSTGAHINPAVSLGMAIAGHLSWFKLPVYWAAQLLGGFVGSGIGFGVYKVQLERKLGIEDLTTDPSISGIFAHYAGLQPNGFVGNGILDQATSTAALLMAICAVADQRNMFKIPPWFAGLFFGLVVAGVNFAFGVIAGGSMNPARDMGPRLMALAIGWSKNDVFMYQTCLCNPGPCIAAETDSCDPENIEYRPYWLIPMIGPFIGATVGVLLYIFLIGSHLPESKEEREEREAEMNNNNSKEDWRTSVHIPKAMAPPNNVPNGGYAPNRHTNGFVPNGVANQAYEDEGLPRNRNY